MESNLFFLLLPPAPSRLHNHHLTLTSKPYLLHHHSLRFSFSFSSTATKRRRNWDSNAAERPETVRSSNRFKFNENDGVFDNLGYEDDDGDFKSPRRRKRRWWNNDDWEINRKSSGGLTLEDVIHSIWILKVLKSYGWLLPFIVISLLLTSGPKAFLTAFSVLFGLSLFLLAYEKLSGKSQGKRKRKSERRRKPFVARNLGMEEQEDIEQRTEKGKTRYQSWMDVDDDSSVKKVGQATPGFGGWDELDGTKSTSRTFRTVKGSQRRPVRESKLSVMNPSDTPLLLRLLIAVFPFLGSWTKML